MYQSCFLNICSDVASFIAGGSRVEPGKNVSPDKIPTLPPTSIADVRSSRKPRVVLLHNTKIIHKQFTVPWDNQSLQSSLLDSGD